VKQVWGRGGIYVFREEFTCAARRLERYGTKEEVDDMARNEV
jgi:hypothetical protein